MRAGGTQVAFFDQPNLHTSDVGPFHRALDEFLQELFQRLLMRDLHQYLRGEIGIEPVLAGRFHNRDYTEMFKAGQIAKYGFSGGSIFLPRRKRAWLRYKYLYLRYLHKPTTVWHSPCNEA